MRFDAEHASIDSHVLAFRNKPSGSQGVCFERRERANLGLHARRQISFDTRLAEQKVSSDRRERENLGLKADLQLSFAKRIEEQVCYHIREKDIKLAIESDRDK